MKFIIKPTLLLVFVSTGAVANALPPLETNDRVHSEFLAAAIGDKIRKNCGSISPRIFRVLRKMNALEDYAHSLGYTDADIENMRKNPDAKAKLNAERDAYLAQNGVEMGNEESYCRLGRQEIEKNSLTGWLLREN